MPIKNLFGTSGVRGLIGSEIDENFSYKLGLALGKYLKSGRVLVARDPRPGAEAIALALQKGLVKIGIKVDDAGILSTPELTWYQVNRGYAMGISVTGSHLPWEMIGIIPTLADGAGISGAVGLKISELFYEN